MRINAADLIQRIGLASRAKTQDGSAKDVRLTGASTDPDSGLIASLQTTGTIDKNGKPADIKIKYWRHLPYGESKQQSLFTLKTVAGRTKNNVDIDELWVQSARVYKRGEDDSNDPEVIKRVNRVLEGMNRLNTHLRNKGDVSDTAKILADCYIEEAIGENLTIRGLHKEGGFAFTLAPLFVRKAGKGKDFTFSGLDEAGLKTLLGARINTIEPDKDFSESCNLVATDPQPGLVFDTGPEFKTHKNGDVSVRYYISPRQEIDGVNAAKLDKLLYFKFKKLSDNSYKLNEATFSGEKVDISNPENVLKLMGAAQRSGKDVARDEYPRYMDHFASFDLLDQISQLPTPPALKQGGEFLYLSLHGTGQEKRIEQYGDQIGLAEVFFHRGLRKDGTVSSVAHAVDFPFASGGTNSNFDGAIPDYIPFWDDIKSFSFTHDHYDHCDGMAYYAKAGKMKEKTVYATAEVKYFLDKKMDFLKVPRTLRPKIKVLKDETPICIKDETGTARLWVQPCPNGVSHSARCTPYIVTGCYGDDYYKGSVLTYGDGNAFTQKGIDFLKKGTRALGAMDGVTPEKVDRDLTVTLHDPTAVNYDGHAPTSEEVETNLQDILDIVASDKGVLMTPISTNDAEYTIGLNVAHNSGRDLTAVGRNAELRLSCKNLFGVQHDNDLREVYIDPFEEMRKPDPLIPQDVLDIYMASFNEVDVTDADIRRTKSKLVKEIKENEDLSDLEKQERIEAAEQDAYEIAHEAKLKKAQENTLSAYREILPPSEREHIKSTKYYMLKSLMKHGSVVFDNDVNGYLMWKAIMERQETASIRATRTSQMAKSFRINPSRLMIFITGTQGNAEERFSTLQKFKDFFSLRDVDESVRNTGYKINAEDFVTVTTQSAIVGNEADQEAMINELCRNRNVTHIGAYMNGFKVYNPKGDRDRIMNAFRKQGWTPQLDPMGNIHVSGVPIHYHGHGFREDLKTMMTQAPSETHEIHHNPSRDNYHSRYRPLVREMGLPHSDYEPDDFNVMRVDRDAKEPSSKFKKIAQINPSYVLVRLQRKYGQYFGGWLDLRRVTLLRREGMNRTDGMMTRSDSDGVYQRKTTRMDWDRVSNPANFRPQGRTAKIAPSIVDRGPASSGLRSTPIWSNTSAKDLKPS